MKLVKILIVLGLLGGAVYVASSMTGKDKADTHTKATADHKKGKKGDGKGIHLEEKYGFTSEQALP